MVRPSLVIILFIFRHPFISFYFIFFEINCFETMNRTDTGPVIEEHQRPRRPNVDTITYLRSLPLDVTVSTQEITEFLSIDKTPSTNAPTTGNNTTSSDEPPEYPSALTAALSAVDEISNEIASLAGEEHAAECIEVLAHITAPYSETAARKLLYSCSGYALHLSTHRYGSHVLQTLLQLAVTSKSDSDMALHEDAPQLTESQQDLPSLTELLLSIQEELTPYASSLAIHICGSHVLRTLACVLGGVELQTDQRFAGQIQVRRGKTKSKKKKKKSTAPANDGSSPTPNSRMSYLQHSRISSSDADIQQSLKKLTEAVSGSSVGPPGELQTLACHPSGGPLLMVLLRVLTYSAAESEWRAQFESMEGDGKVADHHVGVLREEPTFPVGSAAYALAERLLCLQSDKEEQAWTGDVIYGMSGEPRGSHVLESLFRLSPDQLYSSILQYGDFATSKTLRQYAEHDVSNFVVQTLLATTRNTEQVERMIVALEPLVSSGYVLDAANKRRGILWRLVEMVANHNVGHDRVVASIQKGFATLRGDKTPATLASAVPALLSMQKPEKEGARLVLDVAGTRAVFHLLRFDPGHCKGVLKGITALPQEDLELIAKDGLGSRCILDGVLENASGDAVFAKAIKQLLAKLQGRWVALSVDRVGHHTVKKVFRSLGDMDSREELVKELVEGTNRLTGNAMGRGVLDACSVREYMSKGQDEWRKAIQKTLEREEWLKEMDSLDTKSKKERKRPAKDASAEPESKKIRKADVTVDSILEAISIPADAARIKGK